MPWQVHKLIQVVQGNYLVLPLNWVGWQRILPRANLAKLFMAVIYKFRKKLERLSLASLSSLVYCLWVKPEPTRVKHISGAPLLGRLPGLAHAGKACQGQTL